LRRFRACAIALGGSRARGWHNPHSDVDIGLYYEGSTGLDIAPSTKRRPRSFSLHPKRFADRAAQVFAGPEIRDETLAALVAETQALAASC
jgi:hypothetical protein